MQILPSLQFFHYGNVLLPTIDFAIPFELSVWKKTRHLHRAHGETAHVSCHLLQLPPPAKAQGANCSCGA